MNAWLIEKPISHENAGALWLSILPRGLGWGTANEAIRFARKEDATAVLSWLLITYAKWMRFSSAIVTEHSWPENGKGGEG
jgi:hypothetical protein